MLEKIFHLKEHGTNVKTEIVAGLSTFMTMAYIIALNPNLITNFGANGGQRLWNAVFLATVISAFVGTLLMALLANKPFALASGMGLNAYFGTVVAAIAVTMGVAFEDAYPAGLAIILVSGVFFTVLTLLRVREKIVAAIPESVRMGIPAGIGLMLVNIGLGTNAGIFTEKGAFYMLGSFFTDGPSATKAAMGDAYQTMILYVLTFFVGVLIISILAHKNVTGSILLGIVGASVFYWIGSFILGNNPFVALKGASFVPPFKDMLDLTLFKFDFKGLFSMGIFSAVMTIISFCMVDMFDTIGTLIGTAKKANMLTETGEMENMNKAMLSDSLATCVGACTGTSTVTTFIESAAGVEEGGRTGLTSLTTAIMFLLCMFIAPIAALIPAPATSAALVYVGVLMFSSLKDIDYTDVAQSVSTILMVVFMMVTGGIGNGIGIGLIAHSAIKLCTGRAKEVSPLTIVLSILFLGKFFLVF